MPFLHEEVSVDGVESAMDIKSAFEEFAGGETHMSGEQLRRFVREHQGEKEPDDGGDLELLHLFKVTSPFLSLEDFQYFLFSDELNPPISTQVHHDMTAPLSHYYIYTGHNSYLTGNQLSSDCSDVPIIKALQRGVRVIELDMWPNSKRDDINILHGRTLTAPVKLIKCLTSIKEYAFSASPYPLVLTLEDHLTPDLQAKVAQMVTEMFGDMLYYPKSEWLEEFPSPEDLKNRIILSTNPPKKYLESKNSNDKDDGSFLESKSSIDKDDGSYLESKSSIDKDDGPYPESKSSNDKDDGSYPESKRSNDKDDGSYPESKSSNYKENGSCPESKSSNNKKDGPCLESQSSNGKEDGYYPESKSSNDEDGSQKGKESSDEEMWKGEVKNLQTLLGRNESQYDRNELDEDEEDAEDDLNTRQKSAPEYTCLITIRAGKPKNGLRKALQVDPDKVRRLSLSEQELERGAAYYGSDLIKFTQKNLLRIYPKGTRFDSSNYNPLIGWMHGAQMVAFNMQGYGKFLWLMQGLYRGNGGCGYIKKPFFLLNTDPNEELFDPKASLPVKKTLKVKVYMGDGWHLDFNKTHFDAHSPPDFYARVGIAGVPADTTMKKTRTVEDDWTPVWDEELTFPLTVPELALLRVEVHEYDQPRKIDFAGQTCLPVSELRPGIRSVPLYDRKGVKYKSVRILMRFSLS